MSAFPRRLRRAARAALGRLTRSATLEAGSKGRRWADVPGTRDPAGMAHASAATVAARAAQRVPSDPTLSRAVEALVGSLVGTGFTVRPAHTDEAERERLVRAFGVWADRADAEGLSSFAALTADAVRDMCVLGEALLVFDADPDTGAPVLRRLHPEQLDRAKTTFADRRARVVEGVEFDEAGRRAAYWIAPGGAAERGGMVTLAARRVPATDVVHLFRPLFPGQVRGVSWLAPVLLAATEFHGFMDATLERQRLAASALGVVQLHPDVDPSSPLAQAPYQEPPTIKQGSFVALEPGEQVQWRDMPDAGDVEGFATAMLRTIAAGIGITFEQLSGDYSKVNYSSARAAMLEYKKFVRSVQDHIIVHRLCRPVWERFIRWQVLTGQVSAAAFQQDATRWLSARWLPPHWPSVDPVKDAEAAVIELRAGLRSRAELVAERGGDIEELDRQLAAERAREAALGLRLGADAPRPGRASEEVEP